MNLARCDTFFYGNPSLERKNYAIIFGSLRKSFYLCSVKYKNNMSYTKEPIVIENPSEKLIEAVKNLKERKRSQLEKLRKMKPEEFSCRILL